MNKNDRLNVAACGGAFMGYASTVTRRQSKRHGLALRALLCAGLFGSLVVVSACETTISPAGAFGCATTDDCDSGYACVAGVCVTPEQLGDISLPDGYAAPDAIVFVEIVEKIICPDSGCNDGNPCTQDTCVAGKCVFSGDDTATCDDGDACTGSKAKPDACVKGVCSGAKVDCDDGNPCTVDSCDAKTGCGNASALLNGKPCDDGDACTGDKVAPDGCKEGICAAGATLTCDDSNGCTKDSCDKIKGCVFSTTTAACDDGDPCTGSAKTPDSCAAGACVAGEDLKCACKKTSDCKQFEDGNACNGTLICDTSKAPWSCVVDLATAVTCDSSGDVACLKNTCDPKTGGCAPQPVKVGSGCDDNDACTAGDSCKNGSCAAGKVTVCDDGRACTIDACDAKTGACTAKPGNDGASCGGKGTCSAGNCLHTDERGVSWSLVPAGTFFMGCSSADSGCESNEKPQVKVSITQSYWMGVYEVTAANFGLCRAANGCTSAPWTGGQMTWQANGKGGYPINGVNRAQAMEFCAWAGGSLPTEAQWAMAARGRCLENGGDAQCAASMRPYTWGTTKPTCLHAIMQNKTDVSSRGCGAGGPVAVGGTAAGHGPYGMVDLAGNVWEMTADKYAPNLPQSSISGPKGGTGPTKGDMSTIRGGSYFDRAGGMRAGARGSFDLLKSADAIGFRCVAVAVPCDDGLQCTIDTRNQDGSCSYAPVKDGTPCADGDICSTVTVCKKSTCTVTKKNGCDDGNSCTTDLCDPVMGCVHKAAVGTTCDDGDLCTSGEKCGVGGQCGAAILKSCDDGLACTLNTCDAKSGTCTTSLRLEGSSCGGKGSCKSGNCISRDSNAMRWGLIPRGTFFMGCNSTLDKTCPQTGEVQHKVTITNNYWMGLTEVTVADYEMCMSSGACKSEPSKGEIMNWGRADRWDHPVNGVSWTQAVDFCTWTGGSLPTEAQWEMAARGRCDENGGVVGCAKKMRTYVWGEAAPTCIRAIMTDNLLKTSTKFNVLGCGELRTWSVGSKPSGRSPYGMLDMAGNVWEWTADRFQSNSSTAEIVGVKGGTGPKNGATRVFRGASLWDLEATLRASVRVGFIESTALDSLGFRCVRGFDLCDDGNPCTKDGRNKAGDCTHAPLQNGMQCSDGDHCSLGELCKSGKCVGSSRTDCDDKNPCTVDRCLSSAGKCMHSLLSKQACCEALGGGAECAKTAAAN